MLIGGVGLPVYGIPIFPHTLVRTAPILRLHLVRIPVGAEHCAIRDCGEGFVGDGYVRLFGVDLCYLHSVDVLVATFVLAKVVHNLPLDDDDANLVKAAAVGLEVHKHVGCRDL